MVGASSFNRASMKARHLNSEYHSEEEAFERAAGRNRNV